MRRMEVWIFKYYRFLKDDHIGDDALNIQEIYDIYDDFRLF